jgi:hypothetical protein
VLQDVIALSLWGVQYHRVRHCPKVPRLGQNKECWLHSTKFWLPYPPQSPCKCILWSHLFFHASKALRKSFSLMLEYPWLSDTVWKRRPFTFMFNLGNKAILEIEVGSSLTFFHSSRRTFMHHCFWSFVKSRGNKLHGNAMLKISLKISWQTP